MDTPAVSVASRQAGKQAGNTVYWPAPNGRGFQHELLIGASRFWRGTRLHGTPNEKTSTIFQIRDSSVTEPTGNELANSYLLPSAKGFL